MTKTKSTKRALLLSGLALIMCVSLLIGTTFAWFTDSVTSSGNIIKSGKLDVEMMWKDATENGAQKTYKDASTGAIFNYSLWEPGYVEAKNIMIDNVGNLALKYQLNIIANGVVSELADVIDVFYAKEELLLKDRDLSALTHIGVLSDVIDDMSSYISGELLKDDTDYVTIALKMQESAGNEYRDMSIGTDFSVQLLATQYTYEADSFDNQYDKDAEYNIEVATATDLAIALKAGGNIKITSDIQLDKALSIDEGTTVSIDLGGKTITAGSDGYVFKNYGGNLTIGDKSGNGTVVGVVYTETNGSMVINGGTYNAAEGGKYVLLNSSGHLTINDGVVNGGSNYPIYSYDPNNTLVINDVDVNATRGCVNVYGANSNVEINGGTYTMTGDPNISSHIAYFANGDVTINGGTFKKVGDIDMSKVGGGGVCAIYGAHLTVNGGNFAGDYADIYDWGSNPGQRAVEISVTGGTYKFAPTAYIADGYVVVKNADGTWTVVKGVLADSDAALSDAVSNNESDIYLANGNYTMPSNTTEDVTISGTKDVTVTLPPKSVSGNDNVVTFDGITIQGNTNGSFYSELFNGAKKVVYKNCDIYGQLSTYSDVEFINCNFYNTFDNDYSVYCYSGKNITFTECDFDSKCSKAVKVYDEGNGGRTVTLNKCTFTTETANKKAGVEIDSRFSTYYIYINDCKIEGAYTKVWNADAGEDMNVNVCVDGTWVKGAALTK